jgi:TIR domain
MPTAVNPLIFLSYSSKDKLVADAICSRLENQNIRCWIAPRDVKPGSDYSNQIADALESATIMVMVFSSDSNNSRHVKSEIDRAFSLGKIIIPFRVENVELDKGLAYYLAKTHWLDAVTKPLEQHIDRLATTIRQVSGTEEPERPQGPTFYQPPPPPPPPAQPAQAKTIWLVGGIAVLCALIGSIGLLFLWLNKRQAEAPRTLTPLAQSSSGPTIAPPSTSPPSSIPATTAKVDATPANPPPSQDLFEGAWKIAEAETLNGNPYTGTVRITKEGGRYEVKWRSSASNHSGIGLASGNKLCVGWGPNDFGVVFYKIGTDGTLRGRWTSSAAAETSEGLENASGGSPGQIEGEYVVKGSNLQGNIYEGKLKVAKTGQTFQLEWVVAGSSLKGVGLKVEDGLFVAWGAEQPFGIVSYTFDAAQARGIWTLAGQTRTATENLAK